MARILLIDDDRDFSALLAEALEADGHRVEWVERAEPALERLAGLDVVLLDNRMPGMQGIDFLEELRRRAVQLPVLLMTGHDAADIAIRASKLGAFKFFPKPDCLDHSLDRLLQLVRQAVAVARPGSMSADLTDNEASAGLLVGRSEAMCEVYELIGAAALHDEPVLLSGETGTGKELAACALFRHSERAGRRFLKVSCAAFDDQGLEDELFGYEAGAYPGADSVTPGAFERADGGVVLLDEVGEMGLSVQAKLLRVLQQQTVTRGGRGGRSVSVNVRVLATTQRDLRTGLTSGRFDPELFFLLNRAAIRMPPLRERGHDIQLLADHFLARSGTTFRRPVCRFREDTRAVLAEYSWPGNVRELQAVVRHAVLASRGPEIGAADLRLLVPPAAEEVPEAGALIRRAVRAGLHTGRSDLASFLRGALERELNLHQAATTAAPDPENERSLPPSRQKAYQLFRWAVEQSADLADVSDAEVFRWLQDDPRVAGEGLPEKAETFERYLREARSYYHDHKHTPRYGRVHGRSVVAADRL